MEIVSRASRSTHGPVSGVKQYKSSHDNGIHGAKALEAAALYFAKHRNRHSRRQDGEHTISRELLQTRLRVHAATAEPRCRQEVSRIFRNIPESLSVEAFLDLMVHLGCIFNNGNDLEAQVLQLLMVLEP